MNKLVHAAASIVVVIGCLAGCSSDAPVPNASASDSAATQVVAANAVSLRTIEPDGTDFSDLEPFAHWSLETEA